MLLPIVPEALEEARARGDPGEPQGEAQAPYAGLFEETWRTIDWTAPTPQQGAELARGRGRHGGVRRPWGHPRPDSDDPLTLGDTGT